MTIGHKLHREVCEGAPPLLSKSRRDRGPCIDELLQNQKAEAEVGEGPISSDLFKSRIFSSIEWEVKRKSCSYCIPDSVSIKNFFQGSKVAWFLRLDATCIEHVQNQVAPMTKTMIPKQGNDPVMPYVESAGGSRFAQHGSLGGRQCFQVTTDSPNDHCEKNMIPDPAFKKSKDLNRVPLIENGSREYSGVKENDSTYNVNNVMDRPNPENHVTFEGKWNANDNAKKQNEKSKYVGPEEPSTAMHDRRRKERLKEKCILKDVVCVSQKDVKMKIHSSLGVYPAEENLLFDNPCKEHAFEECRQGKADSHDGEDGRSCILCRKSKEKINSCKDSQSRCNLAFPDGNKFGHCIKGHESNATYANVDGHKLLSTQKDQGASLYPQAQVDCHGSVSEAVGREDMTSPTVSVTGIIARYFFEFDEVNSQTESPRNTTECSNKTNESGMQKVEDAYHSFIASNVQECKSKITTSKKFRKHKVLPSSGTGVMDLAEKRRTTVSHDTTDKNRVNQGHQNGSTKAGDSPQAAVRSPPIQFSFRWSASPITGTPLSKPDRSEVGKRLLLAANGLGISTSKQKPQVKCCSRIKKLSLPNSFALAGNVFEISSSDD